MFSKKSEGCLLSLAQEYATAYEDINEATKKLKLEEDLAKRQEILDFISSKIHEIQALTRMPASAKK